MIRLSVSHLPIEGTQGAGTPPIGGECPVPSWGGVSACVRTCPLGSSKPLMRLANGQGAFLSDLPLHAPDRPRISGVRGHSAPWSACHGSAECFPPLLNSRLAHSPRPLLPASPERGSYPVPGRSRWPLSPPAPRQRPARALSPQSE